MKRILYLSDLYNFYVTQNKNVKFSSKDNDTTIVVHIDEPLTYDKDVDNDLLMYTPIRLCHTLSNRNKSYISDKAMKEAIPTAYNMPILSYIYKDDNDEFQFAGHEFFVNADNEIEYEEQPTGVIPESAGLKLVKYDNDDKSYLEGVGIIWRTYSKAADIIEREKELSVSVELVVDELSFNSKTKELVIDKFRFSGVTILGKDRETGAEIQPGMENSKISIADFSEVNNSLFSQNDKVIKLLSELNEKLDGLNIDLYSGRKEDNPKTMFEKLLEKYNKTIEEIDFEYEGLSDEELEVVFAEHFTPSTENFEDNPKKRKKDEDDTVIIDGNDDQDDDDDQEDDDKDDDDDKEPVVEEPVVEQSNTEEPVEEQPETENPTDNPEEVSYYSVAVTHGDKTQTFAVSLQDKIEALYNLVNDTYAEADGCFYDCTVYDDDKYVIMHSWWTDDAYKQSYKVKKDVYSLVGDRVRVKAVWCTEDEQKALENMRANYSAIEEKLQQYESEPEKLKVLQSEDYAQIKETDAYKKLAERDTYFSMSKDELVEKLDACLLDFAKHNELKFSVKGNKKPIEAKLFGNPTKKTVKGNGRYGGLFSKDN